MGTGFADAGKIDEAGEVALGHGDKKRGLQVQAPVGEGKAIRRR